MRKRFVKGHKPCKGHPWGMEKKKKPSDLFVEENSSEDMRILGGIIDDVFNGDGKLGVNSR